MPALEAASIAGHCKSLLAEMSVPDARKLSAFLDALLSDVVCRQVLPNAVKPFKEAFRLDFSFEPELQLHANSNDALACCCIEAAVSAPQLPGWEHRAVLFYDSFARDGLTQLLGNVRKTAWLQLKLLDGMFGERWDGMQNSSVLKVEFKNVLKPPTSLASFTCPADFCISLKLQKHKSFGDVLAAFIADGCDMTAVVPFVDAEVLGVTGCESRLLLVLFRRLAVVCCLQAFGNCLGQTSWLGSFSLFGISDVAGR